MTDDVLSVRYSPNGKLLAVALLDSTVKVFYQDTLKFFLSLYGHKVSSIDTPVHTSVLISPASFQSCQWTSQQTQNSLSPVPQTRTSRSGVSISVTVIGRSSHTTTASCRLHLRRRTGGTSMRNRLTISGRLERTKCSSTGTVIRSAKVPV